MYVHVSLHVFDSVDFFCLECKSTSCLPSADICWLLSIAQTTFFALSLLHVQQALGHFSNMSEVTGYMYIFVHNLIAWELFVCGHVHLFRCSLWCCETWKLIVAVFAVCRSLSSWCSNFEALRLHRTAVGTQVCKAMYVHVCVYTCSYVCMHVCSCVSKYKYMYVGGFVFS